MKLFMFNNHPVVQIDGQYFIIDTGSPFSFKFDGTREMQICGQSFTLSAPHCTKRDVDTLTGADISGLIGMNVISKTGLTIDLKNGILEFSSNDQIDPGKTSAVLSFELFELLGAKYIITNDISSDVPLNHVIIDTGAPISYVSSRLLPMLTPTGEHYEDLSPEFGGVLQGEYYNCNLFLNGFRTARPVKVGTMPGMLDLFGMFDAILGISSLTDDKIVFDFDRKEIRIAMSGEGKQPF